MESSKLPYPFNHLALPRPVYAIKGDSEEFFYETKDVAAEMTTEEFRKLECTVTTYTVPIDSVEMVSKIGAMNPIY